MQNENTTLSTLVDESNVMAVERANRERDEAIREKKKIIEKTENKIKEIKSNADKQIKESEYQKNKALEEKEKANDKLAFRTALYIGMLGIVLFIVALKSKWFIRDVKDVVIIPFNAIKDGLFNYISWLTSFIEWYDVVIRIITGICIIAMVITIICIIWYICTTFKEEHDNRHLIIAVISFAILCTFGDNIKDIININLIPIYLLFQIIALFVIKYLDER